MLVCVPVVVTASALTIVVPGNWTRKEEAVR